MEIVPGTVQLELTGDVPVVVMAGEHDLASRHAVERVLREAPAGRPLVVDLRRVTFLDCAVLGALLAAEARHPGLVALTTPGTVAHRLVELLAPRLLPGGQPPAPASTKISTTTSDSGST